MLAHKEDIHRVIAECFNEWQKIGVLTFEEVSNTENADIAIFSVRPDNLINYVTDRTPVIAFYPGPGDGGDIFFLETDKWNFKDPKANDDEKDNFYVDMLHEIGHALGLRHSPNSISIMFPYKKEGQIRSVSEEDADNLKKLYDVEENQLSSCKCIDD
jgi:predicted Zn-dependent protease